MALIRQSSPSFTRDAVVLDLGDLKRQGEALQARAKAEADQILAEARAERDRLLRLATKEGHTEGFEQGLAEGREAGHKQGRDAALAEMKDRLLQLDRHWSDALALFESSRDEVLLEARQDVLKLGVLFGEMVVKRAIALQPDAVIDQVAATLSLLAKSTRVSLALHPDDLPLVQEALPSLALRLPAAAHVELVSDPTLDRGGCILRMPSGAEIDASIPTQLQRIVAALLPEAPRENAQ